MTSSQPASAPVTSPHELLEATRALLPAIRAAASRIEAERRLPAELVGAMEEFGLFLPYAPRAVGGLELDPPTAAQVVEELAYADGSAGWITMILGALSRNFASFPVDTVRALAVQRGALRVTGSVRPLGTAVEVPHGYRVRGHWDFQSGIRNATLVFVVCRLMDGDQPCFEANGAPALRRMLIPPEAGELVDTWSVLGMRGTGSDDWVLEGAFVPATQVAPVPVRTFHAGPLYQPRFTMVWPWALNAAVALGIGRAARDTFVALAAQTASAGSATPLRERPEVQAKLGEAEAMLAGARAHLFTAIDAAWRTACAGAADPTAAIAQARLAITHSVHQVTRTVDLLFQAAGTNAIYSRNGLEAHFRDIHTAAMHAASLPQHYATGGKTLLGLEVSEPGW